MTHWAALYNFFSSFGLTAFDSGAIPSDTKYPFLSYTATDGSFDEGETNITVNVYYYGESVVPINDKCDEIKRALSGGYKRIDCDDGAIILKRGNPWCQTVPYEDNTAIKQRMINITAEFLTED